MTGTSWLTLGERLGGTLDDTEGRPLSGCGPEGRGFESRRARHFSIVKWPLLGVLVGSCLSPGS